jgi:hypothetical protein
MALMDTMYYLLGIASVILSVLSGHFAPLGYLAAAALAVMFMLLFLSIPLKLNWSSNLYGHLFRRFLAYLAFMLVIYAVCYYRIGYERTDGTRASLWESVYISVTTFTTLQYGEFRPVPASRPLACAESLMGLIAFVPFFAAFGWLYCQNRLWAQSLEDQATPSDLKLTPDQEIGGWKEVETEKTRAQAEARHQRVALVSCRHCGATGARIEKVYDIIGRTTPLALFIAHCSCGATTKPSTTAYLAAWRWQLASKKRPTRRPPPSGQQPPSVDHFTGQLVIGRSKPEGTPEDGSTTITSDKLRQEKNPGVQSPARGDGIPPPQR